MPGVSVLVFVTGGDVHTPFWAQLAEAFQIGQSLFVAVPDTTLARRLASQSSV